VTDPTITTDWLRNPHVRLFGDITDAMVNDFFAQLDKACDHCSQRSEADDNNRKTSPSIVIEVSSSGGTADNAYRIWEEIRLLRERCGMDFVFLGKTFVYSAGVTIMGAFPKNKRFVTRNTTLLIHERRLTQTINLNGPLKANLQIVKEIVADLENGLRIEHENFAQIIEGTDVGMDEIIERSRTAWYVPAQEALRRRLVEGVI
jgi:ATP-dependent protease ClpP protease subunit